VTTLTRFCSKVKGTVVKLAKTGAKNDEKRRDTIGVEFEQRGKVRGELAALSAQLLKAFSCRRANSSTSGLASATI
jgi:hypothetical protein